MSSIYKVLTEEEWKHATSLGYVTTELDKKDGFIHLSTSKQLALTLHLYFKNYEKVILLEINQDSIKNENALKDINELGEKILKTTFDEVVKIKS